MGSISENEGFEDEYSESYYCEDIGKGKDLS